MKRKNLLALLTTTLLVTSCGLGGGGNPSTTTSKEEPSSSPSVHEHTYENGWSNDDTYHWHAASCGHDVVSGKGEHTFDAGVVTESATYEQKGNIKYTCTVCGFTKNQDIDMLEHEYTDYWRDDDEGHYHACIDQGYEDLQKDWAEHEYGEGTYDGQDSKGDAIYLYQCIVCDHVKLETVHEHHYKVMDFDGKGNVTYYCPGCEDEQIRRGDYISDNLVYYLDGDNAVITGFKEKPDSNQILLEIPETIENHPVIGVGPKAFENCDIISVVFPEGLKYIEDEAFNKNNIVNGSVVLPDSLEYLGNDIFNKDNHIYSDFKEFTIGENLKYMGRNSFYTDALNYNAINLAVLGSSYPFAEYSGSSGDYNYWHLKDINIGDKVEELPKELFTGNSVQNLRLGNSLKSLNENFIGDIHADWRQSSYDYVNSFLFYDLGEDSRTIKDNIIYLKTATNPYYAAVGIVEDNNGKPVLTKGVTLHEDCKIISMSIFAQMQNYGLTGGWVYPDGLQFLDFSYAMGTGNYKSRINQGEPIVWKLYRDQLNHDENGGGYYIGSETNPYLVLVHAPSSNPSDYSADFAIHENCRFVAPYGAASRKGEFTFNNKLEEIGPLAFCHTTSFDELVIPDSVTYIGEAAFANNNDDFTSIKLGKNVKKIEDKAFMYNGSNERIFTSITFNDSLYYIGRNAFDFSNATGDLLFPESLLVLDENNITANSVKLPKSLLKVNLNNIAVDSIYFGHTLKEYLNLDIVDHESFTANKYYFNNVEASTSYAIPDGTSALSGKGLSNLFFVTSISIPSSVKSWSEGTLSGLSALKELKYGGTIEDYKQSQGKKPIGATDYRLYIGGEELTTVELDENDTEIVLKGFQGCASITTVKLNGDFGGEYNGYYWYCGNYDVRPFEGCNNLERLEIKDGVKYITESLMKNVTSLKYVNFVSSLEYIDDGAFYGCTGLVDKNLVFGEDQTVEIEDYAFYRSSIKKLELHNGKIGYQAFYENDSLTDVYLGEGVGYIHYEAFKNTAKPVIIRAEKSVEDEYIAGLLGNVNGCVISGYLGHYKDDYANSTGALYEAWYYRGEEGAYITRVQFSSLITDFDISKVYIAYGSDTSIPVKGIISFESSDGLVIGSGCVKSITFGEDTSFVAPGVLAKFNNLKSIYIKGYIGIPIVTLFNTSSHEGYYKATLEYSYKGEYYVPETLTTIRVGTKMTYVPYEFFRGLYSLTLARYDGTASEWQSLGKGTCYNYNCGVSKIYCAWDEMTEL